MQIKQFDQSKDVQKPYMLPNDMDVFAWSAPFVTECVSQMFYTMLSQSLTIYNRKEEDTTLGETFVVQDEVKGLL